MKKNLLILSLLVSVMMISVVSADGGRDIPTYERSCAQTDLCTWTLDAGSSNDNGLPLGSGYYSGCSQLGDNSNTFWELDTSATATCVFEGTGLENSELQVSIDNDVISCTLNGDIILEDYTHEGCAEVNPVNGKVVTITPTDGTNEIVCEILDRGVMAHFDACVIGTYEDDDPVIVIDNEPKYPTCSSDITVCATVTDESDISFVNIECTAGDITTIMKNVAYTNEGYCAVFSDNTMSNNGAIDLDNVDFNCIATAQDVHGNNASQSNPTPLATYDCADPEAVISGSLNCDEGGVATLDASSSSDTVTPFGDLEFSWTGVDSGDENLEVVEISCIDDGTIDVILTVTDNAGHESDPTTETVEVLNVDPVAIIIGDTSGDEGSMITLTANATDEGIEDTHTFKWIFDSVETDGKGFAMGCLDDGSYIVTLEVTDDDGGVDETTQTITCENLAPEVEAGEDKTVDEGSEVTISPTFTDVGKLDTHTTKINWGDGTVNTETTHIYVDDDIYTVTVTVEDDDGGIGSDTLIVTVLNVNPIADAGEDQNGVAGKQEVCFTGTATDVGIEDVLTYSWNFGDETSDTNENCHTYSEKGNYTVTLTVTDGDGGEDTDTTVAYIYDYSIPLTEGMCNLISIPLVPSNRSVEAVLNGATPDSVWAYKVNSEGVNEWSFYTPEAGELDKMIPGYGYYVCMGEEPEQDTIYQNGEKFYEMGLPGMSMPPEVELTTGWNLIGHYGMNFVPKWKETQDLSGGILTDLADITLLGEFAKPDQKLKPKVGYWAFITGQDNLLYAPSQADYKDKGPK